MMIDLLAALQALHWISVPTGSHSRNAYKQIQSSYSRRDSSLHHVIMTVIIIQSFFHGLDQDFLILSFSKICS